MKQVMVFRLGEECYGLDISKVREIVDRTPLTYIPKAPSWVAGMLNHHGRVVAVLDLSRFFDMSPSIGNEAQMIAVIDSPSADIGVLLKNPLEVISEWEMMEEGAKDTGFSRSRYIGAVLVYKDVVVNVIDVERFVADLDGYFTA